MLTLSMIFGSRLLSSFSLPVLYSFIKYLCYITNRQADKFEKYNSDLGFDRLGATYFQTLGEIATLVWVATDTMETTGLNAEACFNLQICIAYFTSKRCKVRCADERRGPAGMARKQSYHLQWRIYAKWRPWRNSNLRPF